MLPLRFSVTLKELLKPNFKRPLSDIYRNKTSRPASDNVTPVTVKRARGGCRPPTSASIQTGRYLCTSTDAGQVKNKDAAEKRRKAGILPSLEDLLFYTIAEGQEKIPAHKFTTALKATGLRTGDPRLKECMEMLKITLKTTSDGALDRHLFKK